MTASTEARRAASSSPRGTSKGTCACSQGPLGPHDALGDGRLGGQEGPGDLVGGEAAEQAQGERHPRLGGEHRVAGHEHQAQQVVAHGRRKAASKSGHALCRRISSSCAQLLVLARQRCRRRSRSMARCLASGHQPGARVVGDARLAATAPARRPGRPGPTPRPRHVAHHPGEPRR